MRPKLTTQTIFIILILSLANIFMASCNNSSSTDSTTTSDSSMSVDMQSEKKNFEKKKLADEAEIMSFYGSKEISAPQPIKEKLDELRKIISDSEYKFQVGYTSVLDKPISQITGEIDLSPEENKKLQKKLNNDDSLEAIDLGDKSQEREDYLNIRGETLSPNAVRLDLRGYGLVTPVKNQNPAGACWAFGAMAAFESSYLIQHTRQIQASEQYVINCSGAGTAKKGGLAIRVFDWMVMKNENIDSTLSTPYLAKDENCSLKKPSTDYFASRWHLVNLLNDANATPSVQEIKEALCKHGVISASVYVSSFFQGLTVEVLNERKTYIGTNHAISIIGWDDDLEAWIIKNSWGSGGWGSNCGYGDPNMRGFGYIHYNSNNIGKRAAWVEAK